MISLRGSLFGPTPVAHEKDLCGIAARILVIRGRHGTAGAPAKCRGFCDWFATMRTVSDRNSEPNRARPWGSYGSCVPGFSRLPGQASDFAGGGITNERRWPPSGFV